MNYQRDGLLFLSLKGPVVLRSSYRTHFYPLGVPMLFLSPIIGGPELVIPCAMVYVFP